jgi:hypothetical protein
MDFFIMTLLGDQAAGKMEKLWRLRRGETRRAPGPKGAGQESAEGLAERPAARQPRSRKAFQEADIREENRDGDGKRMVQNR